MFIKVITSFSVFLEKNPTTRVLDEHRHLRSCHLLCSVPSHKKGIRLPCPPQKPTHKDQSPKCGLRSTQCW